MFIAALIPLNPSANQILTFSATGFLLVMTVLLMLSAATSLIGYVFVFAEKLKAKCAAKPVATVAQTPSGVFKDVPEDHARVIAAAVAAVMPELEEDSGRLVAVLSAAATVALGEECTVINFKPVSGEFSKFGREQIFASRNYTPAKFKQQ